MPISNPFKKKKVDALAIVSQLVDFMDDMAGMESDSQPTCGEVWSMRQRVYDYIAQHLGSGYADEFGAGFESAEHMERAVGRSAISILRVYRDRLRSIINDAPREAMNQ